jgi:hypothetical protein
MSPVGTAKLRRNLGQKPQTIWVENKCPQMQLARKIGYMPAAYPAWQLAATRGGISSSGATRRC